MIQINLFTAKSHSYRFRYTKFSVEQLSAIKKENAEKIALHLYTDESQVKLWTDELNQEKYESFEKQIHCMPDDSYLPKVKIAQQTECEFSIKWDDDIFINSSAWDFLIENIDILNTNPDISIIAPILSNGMPSVDLFIKDFLTEGEIKKVHNIFLKDGIKNHINIWNCNFKKVQSYLDNVKEWNADEYWDVVRETDSTSGMGLPNYMPIAKGVHPARFSYDYNKLILDKISDNKNWITSKREYGIETHPTLYFCNNLFATKTSFWKDSQKLFYDGWDEGQLTLLNQMTNKKIGYIRNVCGIHMAYGYTEKQKELEVNFILNLLSQQS
jgi:hypothetical protein